MNNMLFCKFFNLSCSLTCPAENYLIASLRWEKCGGTKKKSW